MMLADFAIYLQSHGAGVLATDLFYGQMPDEPDTALCLYEFAGRAPDFQLNGDAIENPGLQVVARSKSYLTARSKIESVNDLLSGKVNLNIGSKVYHAVIPQQSPFPIGADLNGRHRLAVNYNVMQ